MEDQIRPRTESRVSSSGGVCPPVICKWAGSHDEASVSYQNNRTAQRGLQTTLGSLICFLGLSPETPKPGHFSWAHTGANPSTWRASPHRTQQLMDLISSFAPNEGASREQRCQGFSENAPSQAVQGFLR